MGPWGPGPKGVLAGPGTPRDPKSDLFVTNWVAIQPFCAILQPNLRRISVRISPDRSHPLNLNFCFHKFGPDFHEKCGFLTHFRINSAPFWTNILIFFFVPKLPKKGPGGPGGPWGPWGALFPFIFPLFFPLFPPLWGPLFFLLYCCDIPPISPLKAAALL